MVFQVLFSTEWGGVNGNTGFLFTANVENTPMAYLYPVRPAGGQCYNHSLMTILVPGLSQFAENIHKVSLKNCEHLVISQYEIHNTRFCFCIITVLMFCFFDLHLLFTIKNFAENLTFRL